MTIPQFEAPQIIELQELLPAYEILDFIAKGGMGAVYQARQISLDREVAIKILPREFGDDPEFRRSFEAEAKAMAKLNHPNLVGVYDFGEVDGMPYIVMEYVDGNALHYSSHGIAIDATEAARLMLGICEGLAHAHDAGVLHRDIKPGNILLDLQKRPKIGDFGLACAVDSSGSGELLFGTPGYTAPEAINNPDMLGKRSDVYSAGVVLYELLTGELPGAPFVPASSKASVDPSFDLIIWRAIHPSPDLRFSDAGAMAKEMSKLLESLTKKREVTINTGRPVPKPGLLVGNRVMSHKSKLPASAVGPNWSLLRNLVIIVVLLAAIYEVNKVLRAKQKAISDPVVNVTGVPPAPKREPIAPQGPVEDTPPHTLPEDVAVTTPSETPLGTAFVIELSEDRMGKNLANGPARAGKLESLQDKARNIVNTGIEKHQADVRKNTERMQGELKAWTTKQNDKKAKEVMRFMIGWVAADGRFVWPGNRAPIPDKNLQNLVDACIKRQNDLDGKFRKKLDVIRTYYCENLRKERGEVGANGLKDEVRRFDAEIAACETFENFRERFNIRKPPQAIVSAAIGGEIAFGKWLETVRFRNEHDDGSCLFVDGDFMAQTDPKGRRRPNFRPEIQRIDAERQTVHWDNNGRVASLSINPDRMGGQRITVGGVRIRVIVIPAE